MIEARAMARELQEQLTGAVKASQEQFRKGQETAASAVRTWADTAKAVRTHLPKPPATQLPLPKPKLPTVTLPTLADMKQASAKLRDVKLPEVRLPKLPAQPLHRIAGTEEFADSAERLAGRVLAAQLKFAGRTLHSAAPVLAEGAAFLTKAADAVTSRATAVRHGSPRPAADVVAEVPAGPATTAAADSADQPKADADEPGTIKAGTAKAGTAKASTAKASTAKASTAKTRRASTAKPAAAKPTAAKTAQAKTAQAKTAGAASKAKPAKK